jgi:hypothetical protein
MRSALRSGRDSIPVHPERRKEFQTVHKPACAALKKEKRDKRSQSHFRDSGSITD